MNRLYHAAQAGLLMALLVSGAAAAAPAQCQYQLQIGFPIKFEELKPTIASTINGKPATLLVDTGSATSSITHQSADKLGLKLTPLPGHMFGVGGESKLDKAVLNEVSLGPLTFHKQVMFVTQDNNMEQDLLLGADFLFQKDLEMSMQARTLNMFKAQGCDGAFLAYWDADAQDVPLEKTPVGDPRAVVTVELNGKKLRAMLDSGAQRSVINLAAAAKLGVTPESLDVVKQGNASGIGKQDIKRWQATFKSFSIGGETINNPKIAMADLYGVAKTDSVHTGDIIFDEEEPEMLLGADFLRAHHVLFAFSQRRLYFSYLGGSVFDVSKTIAPPPGPGAAN